MYVVPSKIISFTIIARDRALRTRYAAIVLLFGRLLRPTVAAVRKKYVSKSSLRFYVRFEFALETLQISPPSHNGLFAKTVRTVLPQESENDHPVADGQGVCSESPPSLEIRAVFV